MKAKKVSHYTISLSILNEVRSIHAWHSSPIDSDPNRRSRKMLQKLRRLLWKTSKMKSTRQLSK